MINKELLRQKLLEDFSLYQYRLDNPFPVKVFMTEFDAVKWQYFNDPAFNRKVESLVAGVMKIVEEVEQCSSE